MYSSKAYNIACTNVFKPNAKPANFLPVLPAFGCEPRNTDQVSLGSPGHYYPDLPFSNLLQHT